MRKLYEKDLDALEELVLYPPIGKSKLLVYGAGNFNLSTYYIEYGHSDRELKTTIPCTGHEILLEIDRTPDGDILISKQLHGSSSYAAQKTEMVTIPGARQLIFAANTEVTAVVYEY